MKRSNLRASMLCLTTILAGSFVWAQDDLPVDRAGKISPARPGVRSAYDQIPSTSITTQAGEPVRLSKLMNSSLKSQSGESLGQVQDLIVDPSNGQIQFAVLSTTASGSPGIGTSTTSGIGTIPGTTAGGQLVAIPWRLVSSSGQGQFTASVDRTTLQSAPTFTSSSWPTMNATWMQSINSHYGVSGTSTGSPGSSSGTGTGTGTGIGNPSTPGLPGTPGTPDIGSPGGLRPIPGATPSSGTGTGTGTGGTGSGGAK